MRYPFVIITLTVIISMGVSGEKTKNLRCYGSLCEGGAEDKKTLKKIKRLLKNYKASMFKMNAIVIEPAREENSVALRSNLSGYEGRNVCPTKRVSVYPTLSKEDNVTIVQTRKYKQKVVFETCISKSNYKVACGQCVKIGVLNYTTSCKQLYSKIRLLYVNNNKLNFKTFTIPNACVCAYNKNSVCL